LPVFIVLIHIQGNEFISFFDVVLVEKLMQNRKMVIYVSKFIAVNLSFPMSKIFTEKDIAVPA